MSHSKKRLAINGFGRIGRSVLRAFLENPTFRQSFAVVAINEPADSETLLHLLKYDSTHGRLQAKAWLENGALCISHEGGEQRIALQHETDVAKLNWQGVDIVLECSGHYETLADGQKHLAQGAGKLLFSHPAQSDVHATVVFGINEQTIKPEHQVISNASCTTNAIVPVLHSLLAHLPIEAGTITTLHSAMNDQPVIDAYHNSDLRKARAAMASMIPVDTGLAKGIARIIPEMADKFTAQAVRIPTLNVSALDVTLQLGKVVTASEINQLLQQAAKDLPGVLDVTFEPLASCDFNHNSHSVVVDGSQTQVVQGKLLKLLLWFDNEWGFANRMLDVAKLL